MRFPGMPPAERWLAVGGGLLAAGSALAAAWLVYAFQSGHPRDFLAWPGITSLILSGVSMLMLLIGFFMRKDANPDSPHKNPDPNQNQKGGKGSGKSASRQRYQFRWTRIGWED